MGRMSASLCVLASLGRVSSSHAVATQALVVECPIGSKREGMRTCSAASKMETRPGGSSQASGH